VFPKVLCNNEKLHSTDYYRTKKSGCQLFSVEIYNLQLTIYNLMPTLIWPIYRLSVADF